MSFDIGDYVVYGSNEVCRIEDKVVRCFDGSIEKEYYKLIPVYSKGSTFYIPSDNYEGKVRRLLTKEEIYALIDEMPETEAAKWCDDKNQRKSMFFSVLRSDNYHELISMMRSLYLKREQQVSKGKKLLASDERVMHEAEKLMHHEFAFVLGINENEIENFIESRLTANSGS